MAGKTSSQAATEAREAQAAENAAAEEPKAEEPKAEEPEPEEPKPAKPTNGNGTPRPLTKAAVAELEKAGEKVYRLKDGTPFASRAARRAARKALAVLNGVAA